MDMNKVLAQGGDSHTQGYIKKGKVFFLQNKRKVFFLQNAAYIP
jgi:hypothetical protein